MRILASAAFAIFAYSSPFLAISLAWAQEALPVLRLALPFNELFVDARVLREPARDPTRMLVGLHVGEGNDRFRIDRVGVLLDPNAKDSDYCVRLMSDDTRYTATNVYQKTRDPNAALLVETHSKIGDKLAKTFSASDVIIRIVARSRCGDGEIGAIVPAIPPGAERREFLTAFLNVAAEPRIELMSRDKIVASMQCKRASDKIISYNYFCRTPLQNLHGARLDALSIVTLDDANKRIEAKFPLLWTMN